MSPGRTTAQPSPPNESPPPNILGVLTFVALREAKGISRELLGDVTGRSATTVWRWEHGQAKPPRAALVRMAPLLGVDVRTLATMFEAEAA